MSPSKSKFIQTMEQHVSYIFIYYRGHLKIGAAIFDANGTNLWKKTFILINKNVYYKHCLKVETIRYP